MSDETQPNHPPTQDRLKTGVPGLDALLGGGLLPRRTVLIKGSPGAGKTTLGLQILVAGAVEFDEPGALITFEQQPDQLFDDARRFGWDLQALAGAKKVFPIFVSPEQVLQSEGRHAHALLCELADLAEDHGVKRVLIDSISHLLPMMTGEQARSGLLKFLNGLKALGLTPLMTSELSAGVGSAGDPVGLEAYLVDTFILMEQRRTEEGGPAGRWIQIFKGRGLAHLTGRHPFEIGPHGVVIYPHEYPATEAMGDASGEQKLGETLATGINGLETLLGGGYTAGSIVLVAGLSGTFKTNVAARFLMEGGASGLWIAFQEGRAALAARFGASFAGGGSIDVLEAVPGRQSVEKLFALALDRIKISGAKRVVVDGIGELTTGCESGAACDEAVRWFLRNLRALGATTLLTQQLANVSAQNPMSSIVWPEHADTIVYLGLVEIESRLERVISVLKHRGGPALGDLRAIAPAAGGGLSVCDRFVGLSGVLGGAPLGRRKTQIEEIFQPLYFIRDFLSMARGPEVDPKQRDAMLANLSSETQRLIDMLGRHFDQPQSGEKGEHQ